MAHMIPPTIHSSIRSGAERRLFHVIQRAPRTDDWVCLHSLAIAKHEMKRRAEIDFLIVAPAGVFTLEVKGGGVAREQGVWIFTDRYGAVHRRTEGPFDQAASAMFALERRLKQRFGSALLERVLFGYGVMIPDVRFSAVGVEADAALVYDAGNRNTPVVEYLDRLARFAKSLPSNRSRTAVLSRKQICEITDFLRGDFDLVPKVGAELDDVAQSLDVLTVEQYSVLDALQSRPRLIVEGPAGSGKTFLSVEDARREARNGRRVLWLCFNRLLAAHVRAAAHSESFAGSITVRTFHSAFLDAIRASSLSGQYEEESARSEANELFESTIAEFAFFAAMEGAVRRYDTIIIDEAQDVLTVNNVAAIGEFLSGGWQEGRWRLYLDSNNQASVFGRFDEDVRAELDHLAANVVLTVNCRNTKPIELHTRITSLSKGRAACKIDGAPVEFLRFSSHPERIRKIHAAVERLLTDGVQKRSITILFTRTPTNLDEEMIRDLRVMKIDERNVDVFDTDQNAHLTWSTVSSFKGLENDIVILSDVSDIEDRWSRAITYVGMSRARSRLIVVISKECDATRSRRFEKELELTLKDDG